QLDRHFLHASALAFEHPVTGEKCEFRSPLPAELARFLTALGELDLMWSLGRISRALAIPTVLMALLAGYAPGFAILQAQQQDNVGNQEPIRVQVEAVNILVSVRDEETGQFVTELVESDFEIYEDGVLQEITNFSQQTDLPLTMALCVDTSASV